MLRHVPTESGDPAVLVGLATPDDSAVYRISSDLALVQSVDFFTPIVDDPFDWGRIAAANALSDIYAMGGRPLTALNLVGWPRELDMELLGRVLEGGAATCAEAGVSVVGGHSVDDPEPKYGLSVTGVVSPDEVVRKTGAAPGNDLVLTKPLGTGIISTGLKDERARPEWVADAVEVMTTLNGPAAEAMVEVDATAGTDVTGFGLMGHLVQMLDDRMGAEVDASAILLLDGALDLAAAGVFPGGSARNREAVGPSVDLGSLDEARAMVLFDAQTSGGLLMAVPPERTATLVSLLKDKGVERAAVIGRVTDGPPRIDVRS